MTIVEEILSLMLKRLSRLPRLATLDRNDRQAIRMTVVSFRITVWMVVKVLTWGAVVAAGGFVVAAADGFVEWFAVGIDVESEAAGTAAVGTGVAAAGVGVFLKGVVVFHGDFCLLSLLSQLSRVFCGWDSGTLWDSW